MGPKAYDPGSMAPKAYLKLTLTMVVFYVEFPTHIEIQFVYGIVHHVPEFTFVREVVTLHHPKVHGIF